VNMVDAPPESYPRLFRIELRRLELQSEHDEPPDWQTIRDPFRLSKMIQTKCMVIHSNHWDVGSGACRSTALLDSESGNRVEMAEFPGDCFYVPMLKNTQSKLRL
jgi:hypothetical protein